MHPGPRHHAELFEPRDLSSDRIGVLRRRYAVCDSMSNKIPFRCASTVPATDLCPAITWSRALHTNGPERTNQARGWLIFVTTTASENYVSPYARPYFSDGCHNPNPLHSQRVPSPSTRVVLSRPSKKLGFLYISPPH